MADLSRLDEGKSILSRNGMQAKRKFRDEYDKLVQFREGIAQAEDKPTGSLSVRSSASAGQVTLASGHGIVTGQLFTLNWIDGSRTSCVAGEVSGDNVPFSGGAGDDLPVQSTSITAVHYKTAADELAAKEPNGTISPNAAYRAYMELSSLIGVSDAAIRAFASRVVSY